MSETTAAAPEQTEAAPTTAQKLGAEAIGTFVLVFFGVGSVMASTVVYGQGDYTGIALAFGLTVVVGAYAFGRISGAHFNPAVSVGVALSGRMAWKDAGAYIGAQIAGGLLGGLVLALILLAGDTGWEFGDPLGSNGFGDHGGLELFGALLVEIVATFVFVLIIVAVTDKRASVNAALAPLAIGLTLTMVHLATIGFTGTSVNPARSLGVAFYSGGDAIAQVWLFVVAPLIGGALAGFAYPALFGRDGENVPGSGLNFGGGAAAAGAGAAGYQPNWHGDQQQGQWDQQQWQQAGWTQDEHGQWVQAGQHGQQGQWDQQQWQQHQDAGQQQQWNQGDWQQDSGQQQWDQGAQQADQWQQQPSLDKGGEDSGDGGDAQASGSGSAPSSDASGSSDGGSDQSERPSGPWTPPADGGGTQIRPSSDQ